ncbi:MAG: response regulator, partial [Defluviitaleaceae bacterium]|nr:response regulator [Defluviitaleaceae bacterium]
MRLLIVDDDPLILSSLEISLGREKDIQVVGCAYDGVKAVELCGATEPDAVLMDI